MRRSIRMTRAAAGLGLAVALAAGCTTTPPADETLAQARQAYSQAQANPHVTRFAAPELAEAGQALTRAEQLAQGRADAAQVAHQAYLAEQRARIAQHVAMGRAAEAELARAAGERQRVILQARAREAEAARAQAEAELAESQESVAAAAQAEAQQKAALRAELSRLESQIVDLKAEDGERGVVLTLGTEVLFDSGQANLKSGSRRALENVARFVGRQADREIVIEGFTDSVGPDDFNQALSERRAEAVRDALVDLGVPPERITARGLGEAFPVANNSTAAGRQLNRRVEIVMPGEGSASVGRTAR